MQMRRVISLKDCSEGATTQLVLRVENLPLRVQALTLFVVRTQEMVQPFKSSLVTENRAHRSGDLRNSGLEMDEIDQAIVNDIESAGIGNLPNPNSSSFNGPAESTISINGTDVTYRAVKLDDGTVSVGTYFPE